MQTLDLIADSPAHTLGLSAHSGSPHKIDIKTYQPNTISLAFDDMVMKGLDKVVVSMAAEDPYYVFYSNNYPDGLFFATYPSPVTVLATSLSPVTDPLTFTLAAQISYALASYNHPLATGIILRRQMLRDSMFSSPNIPLDWDFLHSFFPFMKEE